MPKANKSSKKKKYNARFPPARIKKIMQTDEEVGKVAAAVPVIISRSLELFIESLISETAKLTRAKNAKTLSTSHIKQTIKNTRQFDFLCDLVKNVPDHQAEDNGDLVCSEFSEKKGKGRPRKTDALGPGRKKSEGGNKTSSDEDEEDGDVTEDTESDEESTSQVHPPPSQVHPPLPTNSSVQMPVPPPGSQAAAPSYLAHSSLQPSKPEGEGALGYSNNNLVLPTAGSVSQDPLAAGRCMPQIFQHPGLPLSGDQQAALLHIQHPNQPFHRMPSNVISSSSLPHFMPSKDSFLPPPSHVSPAVPPPQPTTMPASSHHHQQQPIDLTNPLRHTSVKDDDDYD